MRQVEPAVDGAHSVPATEFGVVDRLLIVSRHDAWS